MAALAVYYASSTTGVQSKAIIHDMVNSQNNLSIPKSLHGWKSGKEGDPLREYQFCPF
ncbi:hypothetical protein B9Z19DRAFT_1084423 [Tuber borchii]|uniref:Uncharacterized protein n=1 Tax=Tuber borchii TaxID=42251 RepID=A0A2T6ZS28_TUBBO|nr:hypothetical protein B9Z19DRAFT_1084423 [Tuber borchii]